MKGEALKGHLDLILLLSLQTGPAYGYALIKELRDRTQGMLDLSEGTVYPVLHRLEQAGFLHSSLVTAGSRRRRLYSITDEGEIELKRLLDEWDEFVRGIRNLAAGPPSTPSDT